MGCRRETRGVRTAMVAMPDDERGLHWCPYLLDLVDLLCIDSQGQGYRFQQQMMLCCSYWLERCVPVVALLHRESRGTLARSWLVARRQADLLLPWPGRAGDGQGHWMASDLT